MAISQREDDLAWLKGEYYHPLGYGFYWPSTKKSDRSDSSDTDSLDLLYSNEPFYRAKFRQEWTVNFLEDGLSRHWEQGGS